MAIQASFKTTTVISRGGPVNLLPQAMGLDAFWHGRPIWANPLTGEPARQWASGWQVGLAELRNRNGEQELPAPDGSAEWHALVRAHRR